MTPATAPQGAYASARLSRSGFGARTRGKYSAALAERATTSVMLAGVTSSTASQPLVWNGGSINAIARRSVQYDTAAVHVVLFTSVVSENGGITSRLNRSAFSSANRPRLLLRRLAPLTTWVSVIALPSSPPVSAVEFTGSNGSGWSSGMSWFAVGRAPIAAAPRSSRLWSSSTWLAKRGWPVVMLRLR